MGEPALPTQEDIARGIALADEIWRRIDADEDSSLRVVAASMGVDDPSWLLAATVRSRHAFVRSQDETIVALTAAQERHNATNREAIRQRDEARGLAELRGREVARLSEENKQLYETTSAAEATDMLKAARAENAHLAAVVREQESWRRSCVEWQAWAGELLKAIGADPALNGDEPTRKAIREALARLKALALEACDIAIGHAEWNNDDKDARRIAAIREEVSRG